MLPTSSRDAASISGESSSISTKLGIQSKRTGTSGQLRLQLPAPIVKGSLRASEKQNARQEPAEVPENRPYADEKGGSGFERSTVAKGKWIAKIKSHWAVSNLSKNNLRPVIRSSLSAWIGLLLLLVPRTQRFLGTVCPVFFKYVKIADLQQSSFIILVGEGLHARIDLTVSLRLIVSVLFVPSVGTFHSGLGERMCA